MRENRQSGSEGGAGFYTLFLPLSNPNPSRGLLRKPGLPAQEDVPCAALPVAKWTCQMATSRTAWAAVKAGRLEVNRLLANAW